MESHIVSYELYQHRNSSSSTLDISFENDQYFPTDPKTQEKQSVCPDISLFQEPSQEKINYYNSLIPRLTQIYEELSQSIDPTNVREDCVHHGKRISLNNISASLITRRRSTIKKQ